ncbi:MAG: S41 family peptidase [Longimicrobiales bacterium]
MNVRRLVPCLLLAVGVPSAQAAAQGTRLLRHPTVSHDLVAFAYAGDLWTVGRAGGTARRLTATPTVETEPRFSPDGSRIAFTATVGGNTDVYLVSSAGGTPERLTYHPAVDRVRGWALDGSAVIFGSTRTSAPHASFFRLWEIGLDGGLPLPMPMPRAFSGSSSPDGRQFAYEEFSQTLLVDWQEHSQWRHYRGGRTHPIRIIDLEDYQTSMLPWTNSNDTNPMWTGNTIYFLSDRNHSVNLFAHDIELQSLTQLTEHDDYDIMNASAGPDAIVYEQAGYIHLLDTRTGETRQLAIDVVGDLPWARTQFKSVAEMIRDAALSPTGVRTAFEARGEIFTVPTEKGDYRNLTQSPGVHDRSPVWSPDGAQVAWLSDASGEYQLMIGDPRGLAEPRAITLPSPIFYSAPAWSPDGEHVLLQDNHVNLWLIEVASGSATKIDTETYHDPARTFDATWSPDSRWVAYSRSLRNRLRAIFVYSLDQQRAYQITDGMSDAVAPAFDAGGKFLYFLASTNYGPSTSWLEMSSLDRPASRAIYLTVLNAAEPSPLLPESDEEPPASDTSATAEEAEDASQEDSAGVVVRIDVDGIDQRILALDVPAGEYTSLRAGPEGSIFYTEPMRAAGGGPPRLRLQRYQLSERTATPFLEGIRSYTLSGGRKKLLYRGGGDQWGVVGTDRPAQVGDGAIDVAQLQMRVDPQAEWAQIFRETWRIQRDFFYDPEMHGADWQAVYGKYGPMVRYVAHRSDLSYLIATAAGELAVGHSYLTSEGAVPEDEAVSVGLLGADFEVENGAYRIRRIYTGENWNPELRAPLSAPGIQVEAGDYLLEVNGNPLAPPDNLYRTFEGTAGRQTLIRVNSQPTREGSRIVTVVPVPSEQALRARAWIEDNRRRVDDLSDGRLAYVWLPNTAGAGYTAFTRDYYAQQDKEGAIIDERYNQGGMVADYIVNELDRKLMGYFARRSGSVATSPMAGLYGPKVMIINESAGSGGDALPYYFRQRGLGPLVGTRTWGGLVGTLGVPATIDGGGITAPDLAFYDLDGRWAVENEGVAPDIVVEQTPADVIAGRDPQLERAVQEALRLLEQNPVVHVPRPAPIDRVSHYD